MVQSTGLCKNGPFAHGILERLATTAVIAGDLDVDGGIGRVRALVVLAVHIRPGQRCHLLGRLLNR